MDARRFDRLSTSLARAALSRRTAFRGLAAAAVAVLGGALGRGATVAQGTPAAGPGQLAADNSTLFVQTAIGGTFHPNPQAGQPLATPAGATPAPGATPVAATHGDYLLTLTGHTGETIAFSDRPARQFGEVKTTQFFQSMGFTAVNPPNAALVADSPQQQDDVLLLELMHPAFDAATQTLTYEANILQQYTGEVLKPLAAKQQDQTIAAQFDSASLFIDDCPNEDVFCATGDPLGGLNTIGDLGTEGYCWSWSNVSCNWCSNYDDLCNSTFSACNGACHAYINCGSFGPPIHANQACGI